jgi:hypothetical protein
LRIDALKDPFQKKSVTGIAKDKRQKGKIKNEFFRSVFSVRIPAAVSYRLFYLTEDKV